MHPTRAACDHCTTSPKVDDRLRVVAALVAAGADVDAADDDGASCLAHVVSFPRGRVTVQVAALLLAAGAEPTRADASGDTPLGVARARLAFNVAHVDRLGGAELSTDARLVRCLARAEAWWRRRHLMAAVRSRRSALAVAVSSGGSAAAAVSASC